MQIKIVVHREEEGFWAEVPSIPGCMSQGDMMEELLANIHEAVEGCLGVDVEKLMALGAGDKVVTIAI
jgi:predicted RNase H-like HicB family nuclease